MYVGMRHIIKSKKSHLYLFVPSIDTSREVMLPFKTIRKSVTVLGVLAMGKMQHFLRLPGLAFFP